MIKCDICGKKYIKRKSMTNHRRWHKIPKYKEYQKKYHQTTSMLKKGKKNPAWKGNQVSYKGLHIWVRKNKLKKDSCEKCGLSRKLDVSNISGKYKRDLNDWEWLCRKCHIKNDKKKFKDITDYKTKRAKRLVLDNRLKRKESYKKGGNKKLHGLTQLS